MVPGRLRMAATALGPLLSCAEGGLVWRAAYITPPPNLAAYFTHRRHGHGERRRENHQGAAPSGGIFQWGSRQSHANVGGIRGRGEGAVAETRAFSTRNEDPPSQTGCDTGGLTMEDARQALRTLFGHADFRDGQEAVVSRLLAGESCAGVFPTGAGKSICYQLPGTLMARQGLGLTLVVSPLIALMKDQTDALISAGVPCAKLDSTLDVHEVRDIYEQIRAGTISLLYVSPERFNNERFVSALKGVKVALFVVDEAHCISEWGHNFRPDYLRLADFARAAKANARLALTATATPQVTVDIANRLDIPPPNVMRTPFYRPMLQLGALRAPDDPVERTKMLAELLASGSGDEGGAAVVYVTLQKTAVEVAQALVAAGLDARPYHAGLPDLQREETQDWFMNSPDDSSPVVVGTIAFGMGLDKKNVRRVFHFNLPRSPEDLAQQVGRAGRDGELATCQTLVSGADLPLLRSMIYGSTPSPAAVRGLLRAVFAGEGDEADFNFYDISQMLDTKDLVLKTLLAHLQIRGLAKELTPYFETADVELLDPGRAVLDEGGDDADMALPREWALLLGMVDAALKRKRSGSRWGTLRVDDAAQALGVPKTQVARMLWGMSDRGLVTLGKSGKIRARFRVLRRPSTREEAQSLVCDLHRMAVELEAREIGRLDTVMAILCKNEGAAVSSGLSTYFGDSRETLADATARESTASASSPSLSEALSGSDGQRLSDVLSPAEVSEAEIDELWRVGVLNLLQGAAGGDDGGVGDDAGRVLPCDDMYLLARFAAGIRSPRIGKLKLSQLGSFGCCAHCPFPALLIRAEEAVAAAT